MLGLINTFRNYAYYYKIYGKSGITIYSSMRNGKEGERITLNIEGVKHPIHLRSATSDIPTFTQVFFRKEYNTKTVGKLDPKVIVDCGANIGLSSVYYANQFPNAKIFSIEPEASNFKLLKENTMYYPNIVPINAAVWNKRTKLEIADSGEGHWGFYMKEGEGSSTLGFADALSISDIAEQFKINAIDILKIDIEGAEKEVFDSGYEDWMKMTKIIYIELHDRMKPDTSKTFFKALINYNYELSISGELLVCKFSH